MYQHITQHTQWHVPLSLIFNTYILSFKLKLDFSFKNIFSYKIAHDDYFLNFFCVFIYLYISWCTKLDCMLYHTHYVCCSVFKSLTLLFLTVLFLLCLFSLYRLNINPIYFSLTNKVYQGHQNYINKLVLAYHTFYSPHYIFFYT
jgi:hypothetical protein